MNAWSREEIINTILPQINCHIPAWIVIFVCYVAAVMRKSKIQYQVPDHYIEIMFFWKHWQTCMCH